VGKGGPIALVNALGSGPPLPTRSGLSYPLSKAESFRVGKIAGNVGVGGSTMLAILPTLRDMELI
jgi:hypothetical protein